MRHKEEAKTKNKWQKPSSSSSQTHQPRFFFLFCRVVETRLAAALLAHHLAMPWATAGQLADVQRTAGKSLQAMLDAANQALTPHDAWTLPQVAKVLGTKAELLANTLINVPVGNRFKLWQRAKHVYSEAMRVQQFATIAEKVGRLDNPSTLTLINPNPPQPTKTMTKSGTPRKTKYIINVVGSPPWKPLSFLGSLPWSTERTR